MLIKISKKLSNMTERDKFKFELVFEEAFHFDLNDFLQGVPAWK